MSYLRVILLLAVFVAPSLQQFAGIVLTGGSCGITQWYDPDYSENPVGKVDLKLKSYYSSAVAKLAGRVYIIGGATDMHHKFAVKDVQIYDPLLNVTTAGPPLNTPRVLHSAVAFRNSIYICGGKSNLTTQLDTCEYLKNGKWVMMEGKMLEPLNSFGMAVIDSQQGPTLGIFGGHTNKKGATDQTMVYYALQGYWGVGWPMTIPRSDFATVELNGHVVACGGFEKPATDNQTVISSCDIMDSYSKTWTSYTPMAIARQYQNIVPYKGNTYVLGGYSDFLMNVEGSVEWYYTAANASWIRTPGLYKPCAGAAAFSLEL